MVLISDQVKEGCSLFEFISYEVKDIHNFLFISDHVREE